MRLDLWRWRILWIIVMAGSIGWTLISRVPSSSTTNGQPPPSPREGFTAPDFTADVLGGGQIRLSDLRGKVVLVNLWASWCPPCREEMPAIDKVYQEYKDQGFVVLGVNTTDQDDEAAAVAFVKKLGLTFTILIDRSGQIRERYSLVGLPSSFFVDRKGIIRSVVVGGPMSETMIRSKIEPLLKDEGR